MSPSFIDFIKIPSSKVTVPDVSVFVPIRWLSLVLRLKLMDSRLMPLFLAKSLTKDVFPVPFGPIMSTKRPASNALFRI